MYGRRNGENRMCHAISPGKPIINGNNHIEYMPLLKAIRRGILSLAEACRPAESLMPLRRLGNAIS